MRDKHYIRMYLEEMGIYSFDEYCEKVKQWQSIKNNSGNYIEQDKIDALRQIVENYEYNQTVQLSGQYISIDPWKQPDTIIDNYLCLFPKRSFIETSELMSYHSKYSKPKINRDMPPNDFFRQYFRYEKLISNDISHLYPIKADETMYECGINICPTLFAKKRIKNIASISQNGNLQNIIKNPNMFYFSFPWLYNARLDDYIEICDKYPAEFDCFANTIEKIAFSSNNSTDMQEDVLYQLKEALNNIRISYEIKNSQLKTKGIAAVTGIALTCVPFIMSHFFENFNPSLLQSIIGNATITESIKILNDFNDLKLIGINNPFWVVWKWEQSFSE